MATSRWPHATGAARNHRRKRGRLHHRPATYEQDLAKERRLHAGLERIHQRRRHSSSARPTKATTFTAGIALVRAIPAVPFLSRSQPHHLRPSGDLRQTHLRPSSRRPLRPPRHPSPSPASSTPTPSATSTSHPASMPSARPPLTTTMLRASTCSRSTAAVSAGPPSRPRNSSST